MKRIKKTMPGGGFVKMKTILLIALLLLSGFIADAGLGGITTSPNGSGGGGVTLSTNSVFLATNQVANTTYSNIYGVPILVTVTATNTVAAAAGSVYSAVEVAGYNTNSMTDITSASSIVGTYTRTLSVSVPTNGNYVIKTNASGAGNSVALGKVTIASIGGGGSSSSSSGGTTIYDATTLTNYPYSSIPRASYYSSWMRVVNYGARTLINCGGDSIYSGYLAAIDVYSQFSILTANNVALGSHSLGTDDCNPQPGEVNPAHVDYILQQKMLIDTNHVYIWNGAFGEAKSYPTNYQATNIFVGMYRYMYGYLATDESWKIRGTNTSWQTNGTWSKSPITTYSKGWGGYSFNPIGITTFTAGSAATNTFTGTNVIVFMGRADPRNVTTNTGSFAILIDGTVQVADTVAMPQTASLRPLTEAGVGGYEVDYVPYAYFITNLAAGSHTIVVSNTASTSSNNRLYFDGIATTGATAISNKPLVCVSSLIPNAGGIYNDQLGRGTWTAVDYIPRWRVINECLLRDVCQPLYDMGCNVTFADHEVAFNQSDKQGALILTDGIHCTDLGVGLQAWLLYYLIQP